MIGGLASSSMLDRGAGVWLPVPHGVADSTRLESLSAGAYIPRRVEDVKLSTDRVREMKVSDDAGSAGVGGVDGVEVEAGVREKGRSG